MTSTIGIPTTRVSDIFVRQRLLVQTQYDQLELFKLQTQLSTGHRFQMPSEDPIAALRVISIQRLLERKDQVRSNLSTNQSFLSTTDVAMSSIANIVSETRAETLSALGTTTTDDQRSAISLQVGEAIRQLIDIGNQNFRGRYLFAGSNTQVQPFQLVDGKMISYAGNEAKLLSYADVDLLFETNVNGNEAFGAISKAVQSSVDLNPAMTFDTRLADLRGGRGITLGKIEISDGTNNTTIDISQAETIGDVAMLIRHNPPAGRTIDVEVTASGLNLRLVPSTDPAASENLIVREVGGGKTAAELGILDKIGVGNNWLVGEDLDPVLRETTSLNDIVGRRAGAVVRVSGTDNDFIVEAGTSGAALNNVEVVFTDDPAVTVGNETASFNGATLEVRIAAGETQMHHAVKAIQRGFAAGVVPFDAWLDPLDSVNGGTALVDPTPPGSPAAITSGGQDPPFDKAAGIQIVNAGKTSTIDFSGAETVEDLLNLLNGSEAGALAEINEDRTGINVRSRVSGCDFSIGENGGQTATQLGLRTFTDQTLLEDLNYGLGVEQWNEGDPAAVVFTLPGENNELTFTARANGEAWNDFSVEFVAALPGSEGITYDRNGRSLTIAVAPGITSLLDIREMVANDPEVNADFQVTLPADTAQPWAATDLINLGPQLTVGGDDTGVDFTITRADGVTLNIDLAGCTTIEDVRTRINHHPDNTPVVALGGPGLQVELAQYGNGLVLNDASGPGTLTVSNTILSPAATYLGLVPKGETTASVNGDTATLTLAGRDVAPKETEGIFTALLRLRDALDTNDLIQAQRAIDMLDKASLNSTFVRAELGTRQQSLEVLGQRLEDEDVELRSVLSLEYDSDFVEVVSSIAARQAALQASLQATGKIFSMTLLDYL